MLVLTRKAGEQIVITGNIRITLIQIKGESARIGIEAPKNVSVHRREVHEAIEAEIAEKLADLLRFEDDGGPAS